MQNNLPKPDIFSEDRVFSIRICKVINYVKKNFRKQIKENEVAGMVGLSGAAFSRFFKKSTGLSFVAYVNEIRIREAALLLRETEDTVEGIAYTAGFNTPHYFIKIFKRSKGITPREFRLRKMSVENIKAQPRDSCGCALKRARLCHKEHVAMP